MYTIRLAALLAVCATIATACRNSGTSAKHPSGGSAVGSVHGLIYAEVDDPTANPRPRKIFVPGVSVYLRERTSGKQTESITTNSRGWFATPILPAGTYAICWAAPGFEPGCTPASQDLTVQAGVVTPAPVAIHTKGKAIFGKVTFSNGAACSFSAPAFGLEGHAKVTLLDSAGAALGKPIDTNTVGEFVAADPGAVAMRAECDGLHTETAEVRNFKSAAQLTIRNTAPRIAEVFAGSDGRHRAAPGETISISVRMSDAEQKRLHYFWHPSDTGAPFVSQDSATVRWTLPTSAGTHTMYVLVEDEAGGHSLGRVDVITGSTAVRFSATVTETTGAPVADADVTVNGQATTTNAQGYFFLESPTESSRYVLNIHKKGYALLSRILFAELVGVKFSVVKSDSFTLQPGQQLDVAEKIPGNVPGAHLTASANSFVDGGGSPPQGPLTLYLATLDLRDPVGRMPGNSGGVDLNNAKVRVSGFAGVDVEVYDASGTRYNLAPGKTATVQLPVDPAAKPADTPSSLPVWDYDAPDGLWKQVGTATLSDGFYQATLPHFSAISAGAASSNAACMRLHYDPGTVNFPFNLNITSPQASGAAISVSVPVSSAGTDVLAELPPNEPIVLQIDSVELSKQTVNSGAGAPGSADPNPPAASCTSDAYLTVAPTDALGFDSNNLLFSPGGFLNYFGLDDQVSADAYYAAIDPVTATGAGTVSSVGTTVTGVGTTFLSFFTPGDIIRAPTGTGQPRTIESITDDTHLTTHSVATVTPPSIPAGTSYERVGVKTTLDRFKQQNNFVSDIASATYLNAGDLGFGRSMHMWPNGSSIAYYVSNYPDVEAARVGVGLIATVAMDYSPNPNGGSPYTKFYVYNSAGHRVNFADLDGRGAKFVPRLCVICHAGQYTPPSNANEGNYGSRFIGFDLGSYGYSGFDSSYGRAAQEENFRKLNLGIVQSTNPSAGGQELINGWYNHDGKTINDSNQTQQEFTPTGWSGQATLYTDVVRTSCRTCHVNRDAPLDWAKYSGTQLAANPSTAGFKQYGPVIEPYVCGIRFMPHSKVTYINMWANSTAASPINRINELRNAGLDDFSPTLPCPVP